MPDNKALKKLTEWAEDEGKAKEILIMFSAIARRAELARTDMLEFCKLIGRDPMGLHFKIAPFQERWLKAIEQHDRVGIMAPPEHGKTALLTNILPAYFIGRNPSASVAIIKGDTTEAAKSTQAIRSIIVNDPVYRYIFPDIHLARGRDKVDKQTAFRVEAPTVWASNYTLQAWSYGTVKSGPRFSLVIIDDVLNYENTRSDSQRIRDIEKWNAIVENRLVTGGKIVFLTNAHHPSDLAHVLKEKTGWRWIVDNAVINSRSAEGWEETGIPLWPEMWPLQRLIERRDAIGPMAFAQKFLNIAVDESAQRFKPQWIAQCLRNGQGRFPRERAITGEKVYVGVDFAMGESKEADETVFFSFKIDEEGRREVMNIEAGRWTAPEILRRINDMHDNFNGPIQFLEHNSAQAYMTQLGRGMRANVKPFLTTGSSKWNERYGIESVAVEMYNGKWVIPSGNWVANDDLHNLDGIHPEIKKWINEMLLYRPDVHTGDRLMASWIGREGWRCGRVESVNIDTLRR